MNATLAQTICSVYASRHSGSFPVEQVVLSKDRYFNLFVSQQGEKVNYSIHVIEKSQSVQEFPLPSIAMAEAINRGRPYIHALLASLGQTGLLDEIADIKPSDHLPDEMGFPIVSDWGSMTLKLPSVGGAYTLAIHINNQNGQTRRGLRVKFPISCAVVAESVALGRAPLFAAIEQCEEAALLLAEHDAFLSAIVEADRIAMVLPKSLAEASAAVPRKPRGI